MCSILHYSVSGQFEAMLIQPGFVCLPDVWISYFNCIICLCILSVCRLIFPTTFIYLAWWLIKMYFLHLKLDHTGVWQTWNSLRPGFWLAGIFFPALFALLENSAMLSTLMGALKISFKARKIVMYCSYIKEI